MTMTDRPTRVILRLEGISVLRPDSDGSQRRILDRVSCRACEAEITTIVGPSGGGKSSLIRLINRLEDPSDGSIQLNGSDITLLDPIELRGQVAMVTQKPFMFEGTVLDNLQRPFVYRGLPVPEADNHDLLRFLQLTSLSPDLLRRDARTLSLGEQQRVALCRTLLTKPRVLLLDEPTSALDRPTADHLAATLREIRITERLTIVLVTHDLRLARQISDYLYFLEGGCIREEGNPERLFSSPESEELRRFLGQPKEEH